MAARVKRRVVVAEAPALLDELVADELELPLDEAGALVDRGAVYVEGRRARERRHAVAAGARVMIVLEESGQAVTLPPKPPPPVEVLHEDAEVIAVNKPAGIVAQPTPGRVGDSLLDLVSARLGHPAGLVHRLDKETSGVTVFGKTPAATSRLAEAFRLGRAKKQYLAIVGPGLAASGVIDLPLSRDPSRPGRWRASRQANGVAALTRFTRLSDGATCLVALFPETGRTHQLRAHLAGIGFPIVGDALYGGAPGPRCLLHAKVLDVDGLHLEAPLPNDFAPFVGANAP